MSVPPLTVESDPDAYSAAIHVPGKATGPLIGGNLRSMTGSVGVSLPSLEGAIVVLEDFRRVGLGEVDRELTQLVGSGSLDGVAGFALGLITGFEDLEDRGWTLLDVLHDHLDDFGVLVLGGVPAGHGGVGSDGGPDQVAQSTGPLATLDADARILTMSPCVRETTGR